MNMFEEKLSRGELVIPECSACNEAIWPPNDFCSKCFGKAIWREFNQSGKILEYSKKGEQFFCLVEFANKIRLIGKISSKSPNPEIGNKVRIESCGIEGTNYKFNLKIE